MTKAQRLMKECGQNITILTNDQQLYRLAVSVNMLVKKHHNSPVGSEPDKTCLHHDGLHMGGTRGKLATPPLGSRANNAILFCVAPPGVFEMIKCGCVRDTPCSTAMCGCYTAILPCTMFCGCHGEAHCRNEHTRGVMTVTMLLKVTCSKTESNQNCNGNMHHHKYTGYSMTTQIHCTLSLILYI